MPKNSEPFNWKKIEATVNKSVRILVTTAVVGGGIALFGPTIAQGAQDIPHYFKGHEHFDPDLGKELIPSISHHALAIVHQGFQLDQEKSNPRYLEYLQKLDELRIEEKTRGGVVIEVVTREQFRNMEHPIADGQTIYFVTDPGNAAINTGMVDDFQGNWYSSELPAPQWQLLKKAGVKSVTVVGEGTTACRNQFEQLIKHSFEVEQYPQNAVWPQK